MDIIRKPKPPPVSLGVIRSAGAAMAYQAPWWLPGGNAQTIWAALRARRFTHLPLVFRRERWRTPDGDFVDVDWLVPHTAQLAGAGPGGGLSSSCAEMPAVGSRKPPLLVLFHGLEGSSASHYAQAFADVAGRRGWACAVPHFRGCSGEINLAPRAYHSGDFAEIDWFLRRFASEYAAPVVAVGISLGGNALMRWAGEMGREAGQVVAAVASVCAPLDLAASGLAIGRGFNRLVYTRMFLDSMRPKALQKLAQHPGLFDRDALLAARDLYAFDQVFTGPLHGFKGVEDYWARASAKPHLGRIAVPALALNAVNDPFIPAASLPQPVDVSGHVTLWQTAQGGHVGFPSVLAPGAFFPGHVQAMPEAVVAFLAAQL
jgi:predicted alpha/beta-fold hydrolase